MRHRRNVVIAFAGALVGSGAQVVVPLVERQIVDGVILHHSAPLGPWLAALLVLGVVTFGGAHLRRYHGGRVALDVQFDLRNAMHEQVQGLDFATLDHLPTGQLVSRAISDTALVQGLLAFLPMMSGNVLLLVLSLAVMFWLSPLLALVSVLVAPALLVVSYRMRWRVFPATWDAQQKEGDIAQIVDEDVNGFRVVKAFGQEQRELRRLVATAGTLYGSQMRAVRLQARYQPVLQAIPAVGQVAVLAFGGLLAIHHQISLGTFLAFSTYLTQLVAPARMLAGVLTVGQQARAGIERIFGFLDLRPEVADQPGAPDLPPLRGEIDFHGVVLAYDEGEPVLRGVDLHVAAGETVALVGASGSGKSTLAMTVPRFYDVSGGAVRVDGHDIRHVSVASLRRQIGVVFEESFLFSDTIRANIAYGRPEASADEVEAAARAARAHEFVEALPAGYDTVVGERGLSLSGGQRQRIALARAILTDPRILVLDDATSAVDATVEEAIHRELRQLMRGRTTLLVAHRRSTLHLADRIAVLDGGRVTAVGSHDELMERSARYRELLSGPLGPEQAGDARGPSSGSQVGPSRAGGTGAGVPAWGTGAPATVGGFAARSAAGSPRGHGGGAAGMGAGLHGGGGWRQSLVPTPQLLARVAALRPVRDTADVDVDDEVRHRPAFGLRQLLGEFRRPLAVGLLLVVFDAVATLAGPALVKVGIDSGVAVGSRGVLIGASAVYLVVTLADLVDTVGASFVTGRVAQRVMLSLRIRIWAQLQRLSLDYYEREMAGRIMTRMTTDVDQFESLIENGLLSALVNLVTFVGVGVALVAFDVELGLVTMSVVVPLAAATVVFRRRAARTYEVARERIAVVNADFQESVSGVRESQAFVHQAAAAERFRSLGRRYLVARVAAQRLVGTYFPFVAFLADVADALVLGVGATLVAQGHLTTGALIAFVLYVDLFFSPIQQLSQVFDSWQQTRVSVGRIGELMALDTLTPEAPDARHPPRLRGDVRFDGVRFAYPAPSPRPGPRGAHRGPGNGAPGPVGATPARAATDVLRGVDLHIRAGETVALVGETGAGKSTVLKLLARFYDPDHGRVLVDGMDVRSLQITGFRRQLGYVPQEAFLFTGTVRDNIAYGRPDATDAEVVAAARSVGADVVVAALPGGYGHVLSERGRSLSSGQRQLVALARAALVDPAILLLDEATANLDLATEARVAAAMAQVARGRTTVLIAHRLQTARSADRIVVFDGGLVVEEGSHAQLVRAGGRYGAMWRASGTGADGGYGRTVA